MKRSFLYCGIAVMFSLVACQASKEEITDPNPTYNPKTNEVTTKFVLNVSTNTGKDTKTTAEFAQVNSPFLGMEAVHLLTYSLDYTSANGHFFYNKKDSQGNIIAATRDYNLGSLFAAGDVDDDNASRTLELALPLGTNCVVLYGRALKSHSDDLQGRVDADGDPANLTGLKFTLSPRLSNHAAFEAGSFFFSRMLTCFILSGLVDERENGFWGNATGVADKSYAFWYPVPSDEVAASLPADPTDQQTAISSVDGNSYTYYRGQLSWKQLGTMYDYQYDGVEETNPDKIAKTESATNAVWMTLSPLGEVLGDAYSALVTIKSSGNLLELRAGSASAVLHTMRDLYAIIERSAAATPNSWEEQVAKLLAQAIKAKMDLFFEMDNGTLDFLRTASGEVNITQLKTNLSLNVKPDEWESVKSIVNTYLDASYFPSTANEGFPVNIGLPVGAAIMVSTKTATQSDVDYFSYTEDIPAYGFGTATFPIANYRYPAELMYYGNSPIRVSKDAKTAQSYPSTVALWNSESPWTSWEKDASVKSDTRSVAMINNINYGTALLESTVKFGASKLYDNNKALHPTEMDNELDVSTFTGEKGFFVTGIVVGGQADQVGWNYLRKASNNSTDYSYDSTTKKFSGLDFTGNEFNKMIFDKVLGTYKVGETTKPLYTLVWDNYNAELPADAQSDVYVGLELVNKTGQDLWGEMNLIRNGGTFYLLGKMSLADAVATAREGNASAFTDLSRSYYCYPPFDPANGNTINAPRVFMQDYKTTAKLVLGKDALKHAYMTVPDLRSGQVSLGMSIDMDWEPGLAFDVNMGWLDN